MAFAIEPARPVGSEIQRVAGERLDVALDLLDGLDAATPIEVELAVHSVRKRCKEVRALARLFEPALGDDFSKFDKRVRRAARELASIRDAHAILGTLDDLRAAASPDELVDLDAVRVRRAAAAVAATRSIVPGDERLERATTELAAARRRVRRWDLDDADPIAGVAVTYHAGRRRLRSAIKRPTDRRLHDWRISVKRLWYQMRLLQLAAPSVLAPLVAELDLLGESLGDDHDLAVLVERLAADAARRRDPSAEERSTVYARATQDALRQRAFRLGETLFAERPAAFADRIGRYWTLAGGRGPELPTGGIEVLAADGAAATSPPASEATIERERKFLVDEAPIVPTGGTRLRQGYVAIDAGTSLRVRDAGDDGCTMTFKAGAGAERVEVEVAISREQFDAAWPYTGERRLTKTRYRVPIGDPRDGPAAVLVADVDVFHERLDGLVLAEVEFRSGAEMADFEPPHWFGDEVTDDPAYTNAALAVDGLPADEADVAAP